MRTIFICACLALLAGCATTPKVGDSWEIDNYSPGAAQTLRLTRQDQSLAAVIPIADIEAMQHTHLDMALASHRPSNLYLIDMEEPNAMAGANKGGVPSIFVTLPMVWLLGADSDQWAALFGHESAHLVHHDGAATKSRKDTLEGVSVIAATALYLATGVYAQGATDLATGLIGKSYSRDQERAADLASVPWMCAAGYDPKGAVRLQQTLIDSVGANNLSFLSDHPSGPARIAALEQIVDKGCKPQ